MPINITFSAVGGWYSLESCPPVTWNQSHETASHRWLLWKQKKLPRVSLQGPPWRITCLHLCSPAPSSVTPTNCTSSFTTSRNLLFGLSPFLHLQHPSTKVFAAPPLHVSEPCQPRLFYFVSKTSNPGCSSDVLILIPFILVNPQRQIWTASTLLRVSWLGLPSTSVSRNMCHQNLNSRNSWLNLNR